MAITNTAPAAKPLTGCGADLTQCSVSGLSSGAFMAVQLHLAHSAMFVGAGVIAGGPYRCAESFRGASPIAEDAFVQNAFFICMNPLIPAAGPNPARLVVLAEQAAAAKQIDPLEHVAKARIYLFTGSEDKVVAPSVVEATKHFYELLKVPPGQIAFTRGVPVGHAILTDNLEDNPPAANRPPYINRWPDADAHMQSHDILAHLHGPLKPPAPRLRGQLLRFDQREFFDDERRASMSAYGYVYVPPPADDGSPYRVHVALHGCRQGYNYVDLAYGRPDVANDPPYGNRYVTTTGYNEKADTNHIVVLYPQVEGIDDGATQNPEGCWDWWGYSSPSADRPDYHSKHAIQIRAIHRMLQRLGE